MSAGRHEVSGTADAMSAAGYGMPGCADGVRTCFPADAVSGSRNSLSAESDGMSGGGDELSDAADAVSDAGDVMSAGEHVVSDDSDGMHFRSGRDAVSDGRDAMPAAADYLHY